MRVTMLRKSMSLLGTQHPEKESHKELLEEKTFRKSQKELLWNLRISFGEISSTIYLDVHAGIPTKV